MWSILRLLLYRAHVCRHLERQQGGRFRFSCHQVENRLTLYVEQQKQCIGVRLYLTQHRRIQYIDGYNHRLFSHALLCLDDQVHVALVDCLHAFASIAAVGEVLVRVATGQTLCTGMSGGIVAVLQADRAITRIFSCACSFFVETVTTVGGFDEYDSCVSFLRSGNQLEISFHQFLAQRSDALFLDTSTPEVNVRGDITLGDIHFLLSFQRQYACMVL